MWQIWTSINDDKYTIDLHFVCVGVNYVHIVLENPCDVNIYYVYSPHHYMKKSHKQYTENLCHLEVQLRVKFRHKAQNIICLCMFVCT